MDQSGTTRVTVEEAARLLGIEKGSVKKRVQRGKLRSERDASGTLYVFVDRSETVRDTSVGQSETDRDELVEEMRDRVRSLERRLDEEGESRRRSDTIIAQLTQANTALNERLRELEAPAATPAPTESHEAGAEEPAEGAAGVQVGRQAGTGAPAASVEGSTRRIAEETAGTLIAAAIIHAGPWLVSTVVSIVAAITSFVVAAASYITGYNTVLVVSLGVGLSLSVLAVFLAYRSSRDIRWTLASASDAVSEAMDEELMREEEQRSRRWDDELRP